MKKIFYLVFILPLFVLLSYSSGAPTGYSGSPGDSYRNCTSCHTFSGTAPAPSVTMTGIPATGYVPGTTYNINFSVANVSNTSTGFQLCFENSLRQKIGDLASVDANTQVQNSQYISQTYNGTSNHSWSFQWTPTSSEGTIKMYYSVNIANGNNADTGDYIRHDYFTINEASSHIETTDSDKIILYPNPTNHTLYYITNKKLVEFVSITDLSGKKIDIKSSNNQIDVSLLKSGTYVLKLKSGEKTIIKQFVKK